MRCAVVSGPAGPTAVEIRDDRVIALGGEAARLLLGRAQETAREEAELGPLPDQLLAPVRPAKIVAIGLNYRDHIDEAGLEEPTAPLIFAKFPSAIIGPGHRGPTPYRTCSATR